MTTTAPVRLSNSKSNTIRRCENQYRYKYVDKLKKKEVALPLFRGDWLHQLLMVHYDGEDWRERQRILTATNWNNLLSEEKEELGGNLPEDTERLMRGYLAHWRDEDKRIHIIDSELNEMVELPNGDTINVIIDLIWEEEDGGVWIVDHKTVSRFYPSEFMLLDSQLALYFWAAGKLGIKNLRGAILNELITKPPTLPKFLEASQMFERRKNLHCDAYTYMSLLKKSGQDPKKYKEFLLFLKSRHDEWWQRTRLPRDKPMTDRVVAEMMATGDKIREATKRGVFVRSARKECQYDCSFLDLCMGELQGIDIGPLKKMKYEVSTRPPEQEELERLWPSTSRRTNGRKN